MKFSVSRRTTLLSALLILMMTMIFFVWSTMLNNDTRTNDAYVNADYTLVAPKVSGYIKNIYVADNQRVKAGQTLATLDDRDYKIALEMAQANLQLSDAKRLSSLAQLEQQQSIIAQTKATLLAIQASAQYASQNAERFNKLYQRGTVAADDQQKAHSTQRSASAVVAGAQAKVSQARLNLSYT
ncbi:biotin/lipoyl-binding protein, partial [Acinetobacter baumannii]|nr:biotin/lipoyl-binding protein [Acinetobacter baumannii]